MAIALAVLSVQRPPKSAFRTINGCRPHERKKSPFKDWSDLISRVKGVGNKNAVKFSTGGLTVNGAAYSGAPAAAPAAKPAAQTAPAAAKPAVPATPAAPTMGAKPAAAAAAKP